MATFIYGVSGEGSGHAFRSREVLRHLVSQGHRVHVVAYGRAYDLLSAEFPCRKVVGIHLEYRENAVRYPATIWRNVFRERTATESLKQYLPARLRDRFQTAAAADSRASVVALCDELHPDACLTDFEPFTALVAVERGLPILSIDNVHRSSFLGISAVPWRYRHSWLVARAMIRLMVPQADRFIVTALEVPPPREGRVVYVPPVIRPAVLAAVPEAGEHVVVYNSFADERLPAMLDGLPFQFRVYGYPRRGRQGCLDFRGWGEATFLEDLRTCRAVIGTAGFTLISESLVLRKPYLAIPVAGQFEQIDNALECKRLGFGAMVRRPTSAAVVAFCRSLPTYQAALAAYVHPGNGPALGTVDGELRRLVHGADWPARR